MDTIDTKILNMLNQNARISASEISKAVGLSVPAVAERIRKLEKTGLIRKYTLLLNRKKAGLTILAFVLARTGGAENAKLFRQTIIQHDCVLECHHVTGTYDYLLKISAADVDALEAFITHTLKAIKGVLDTNTIISLGTLKEETNGDIECG